MGNGSVLVGEWLSWVVDAWTPVTSSAAMGIHPLPPLVDTFSILLASWLPRSNDIDSLCYTSNSNYQIPSEVEVAALHKRLICLLLLIWLIWLIWLI